MVVLHIDLRMHAIHSYTSGIVALYAALFKITHKQTHLQFLLNA